MKRYLPYFFIFSIFSAYANEPQVNEIFKAAVSKEFHTLTNSSNFYYCSLSNRIIQKYLDFCEDFYNLEVRTSYHNVLSAVDKGQSDIVKYYRAEAEDLNDSELRNEIYLKRDQSLRKIITLRKDFSKKIDDIESLVNHKKLHFYFYDSRRDILRSVETFRDSSLMD